MATEEQCNKMIEHLMSLTEQDYQDTIEGYCEFLRENNICPEGEGDEWCSDAIINNDFANAYLMHVNHGETSIREDVIQKWSNNGKENECGSRDFNQINKTTMR